jgi:hypothetical protein
VEDESWYSRVDIATERIVEIVTLLVWLHIVPLSRECEPGEYGYQWHE